MSRQVSEHNQIHLNLSNLDLSGKQNEIQPFCEGQILEFVAVPPSVGWETQRSSN